MGTRTSYEPGTFSWVDLSTNDAKAAKDFYAKVFGWTYEDVPMGEEGTYSLAHAGDHAVGGLMQFGDTPPHWNNYVSVESVDDATEKAKENDAEVLMDPSDVGKAGRMSVIQDPTGGIIGLWQAGERAGADLVNAHGSLTWNDLQTDDLDKASEFYTGLFGWEVAPVSEDDDDRLAIKNGESLNGGMAKLAVEDVPSHWLAFFAVDDLDAALKAADEGGGKVAAGPLDIPAGKMAVVTDPQGAVFGLFAGELDD